MIVLSFGNKVSDYSSREKSREKISIQEDNLKEEDRLSGRWYYSVHQTYGPGNHSYSGTSIISQHGSSITITVQGYSASGSIQGNRISININYLIAGASLNGTVIDDNHIGFSITVQIGSQKWGGTATFTR